MATLEQRVTAMESRQSETNTALLIYRARAELETHGPQAPTHTRSELEEIAERGGFEGRIARARIRVGHFLGGE